MFTWLKRIVDEIVGRFELIEEEAAIVTHFAKISLIGRKEQALYISKTAHPAISFSMLDGKDYKPAVWRMVRPKGTITFKRDMDA